MRQAKDELNAVLAELKRDCERVYGDRLVALLLFGSQARGDAGPESDIDIAVVLKGQVQPHEETSRTGPFKAALCLEHDVLISCVYLSEGRYWSEQSPLLLNIRREGIPI